MKQKIYIIENVATSFAEQCHIPHYPQHKKTTGCPRKKGKLKIVAKKVGKNLKKWLQTEQMPVKKKKEEKKMPVKKENPDAEPVKISEVNRTVLEFKELEDLI